MSQVVNTNHFCDKVLQTKKMGTKIDYFPMTFSLAICAPVEVHKQVSEMLTALRHLQDTQVALEVRFVSVSESFMDKAEAEATVNTIHERAWAAGHPFQCILQEKVAS